MSSPMPRQIHSSEEFMKILPQATECRVVRRDGRVKLKLRTRRFLYTYITDESEAEDLLKNVKIPIVEF